MIAACPKCHTRYRVQPEQLGADGARLRCSSCNAVFRVRPPAASSEPKASEAQPLAADPRAAQRGLAERSSPDAKASEAQRPAVDRSVAAEAGPRPAPPARHRAETPPDAPEPGPRYDRERLVLVAHADAEAAKAVAEALEGWGLQTLVAHDGVEAMLGIQRTLPRAVVLDAALPKMYGFQVCEIVKRNESLRETRVVLVGAIHKEERYRRAPRELYGADVYVEPPDLPDALLEILTRFGLPLPEGDAASAGLPRDEAPYGHVPRGTSGPRDARTEPLVSEPGGATRREPQAMPEPTPAPTLAPAPAPTPAAAADPLAAERAKAERLARIIVSDIVLYNPEKFAAAARAGGDVAAAMRDELEEGRALFRERIDAQVRAERDHLAEELARAAKARSGP